MIIPISTLQRNRLRWIGSCVGSALLLASQDVSAEGRSDTLLTRAAETLQAAKTLQAEFTVTTLTASRYRDTQEQGRITLAKPERVRIDITRFRKNADSDAWQSTGNGSTVVSDGKVQNTLIHHPDSTQYRSVPAVTGQADHLLDNVEPLRDFFGSEASRGETQYLGAKTWEKETYEVVEVHTASPSPAVQTVYIGSDGLIRRVIAKTATGGRSVTRDIVLRNVRLNVTVSDDVFSVEAPPGATPFERSRKQELLPAGTVAPDFSVKGSDGKPVRLSDYRGKVVVLKFWASWCWSCKLSLPDTQALAKQYRGDVVVLAVDSWDSEKALANWQKKNRQYDALRFAIDLRPQGAKDAVTTLYQVSATPTHYVIGRDGQIVAGFAGYDGPDDTLKKAVETALSVK